MQSGRPYDIMIDKLIAEQAHGYWERRGRPFGSPEVDWCRAIEYIRREGERHGVGIGPDH
ncbi:MAG: DUF2934 domain-containing protein [Candidatus Acidiferrales bacterium]